LYYLLVILNFFILPYFTITQHYDSNGTVLFTHFSGKLIGSLFFMPNYVQYQFGSIAYLDISWSLAVEEFFYLFFPLLVYWINIKKLKNTFIALWVLFIVVSLLPELFRSTGLIEATETGLFDYYFNKYRLYAFMAGATAAYFYLFTGELKGYLSFLKNRKISRLLLAAFFLLIFGGVSFGIVHHQLYSLFFSVFLFSISSSEIKPYAINNRVINYLGKISYGIYMLHPVACIIVFRFFSEYIPASSGLFHRLIISLVAILLTIVISIFSYELFVKVMLRIGNKVRARVQADAG
jgi:peptidoglycan/LPS O-acetylase OafA/YrhL